VSTAIYWFRNDLRLHDNPAFCKAAQASTLLPVFCLGSASAQYNGDAQWGELQTSVHRGRALIDSLMDLDAQLRAMVSALVVVRGHTVNALTQLAMVAGADAIHCEAIAAPYENAEVTALQQAGVQVITHWQSTLFEPQALPFDVKALPAVFTDFRRALERAHLAPATPLAAPTQVPPLPHLPSLQAIADFSKEKHGFALVNLTGQLYALEEISPELRARTTSSFPYWQSAFAGGERPALAHLTHYFASDLPRHYKATRNALSGTDFSSKFSPWLASGAVSVRQIAQHIADYEQRVGPNEGSAWLHFELLWRDYFRFLHLQYGAHLFRYRGLRDTLAPMRHDPALFAQWCSGLTAEPLVNAAMHELKATGYLSNRLRQVVASYWIHDLQGDWRAGAAWFEAQLIDYDVYSNQGNWLYIAGLGTDPRGGRRFNVPKQAQTYDPDHHYQRLWNP
jgi:deoxyribodipyrimidine photo-lyase